MKSDESQERNVAATRAAAQAQLQPPVKKSRFTLKPTVTRRPMADVPLDAPRTPRTPADDPRSPRTPAQFKIPEPEPEEAPDVTTPRWQQRSLTREDEDMPIANKMAEPAPLAPVQQQDPVPDELENEVTAAMPTLSPGEEVFAAQPATRAQATRLRSPPQEVPAAPEPAPAPAPVAVQQPEPEPPAPEAPLRTLSPGEDVATAAGTTGERARRLRSEEKQVDVGKAAQADLWKSQVEQQMREAQRMGQKAMQESKTRQEAAEQRKREEEQRKREEEQRKREERKQEQERLAQEAAERQRALEEKHRLENERAKQEFERRQELRRIKKERQRSSERHQADADALRGTITKLETPRTLHAREEKTFRPTPMKRAAETLLEEPAGEARPAEEGEEELEKVAPRKKFKLEETPQELKVSPLEEQRQRDLEAQGMIAAKKEVEQTRQQNIRERVRLGAMKSETEQRLAREKSEMTAARKKLEEEIRRAQGADAQTRQQLKSQDALLKQGLKELEAERKKLAEDRSGVQAGIDATVSRMQADMQAQLHSAVQHVHGQAGAALREQRNRNHAALHEFSTNLKREHDQAQFSLAQQKLAQEAQTAIERAKTEHMGTQQGLQNRIDMLQTQLAAKESTADLGKRIDALQGYMTEEQKQRKKDQESFEAKLLRTKEEEDKRRRAIRPQTTAQERMEQQLAARKEAARLRKVVGVPQTEAARARPELKRPRTSWRASAPVRPKTSRPGSRRNARSRPHR